MKTTCIGMVVGGYAGGYVGMMLIGSYSIYIPAIIGVIIGGYLGYKFENKNKPSSSKLQKITSTKKVQYNDPKKMQECPYCGKYNLVGVMNNFCGECGRQLYPEKNKETNQDQSIKREALKQKEDKISEMDEFHQRIKKSWTSVKKISKKRELDLSVEDESQHSSSIENTDKTKFEDIDTKVYQKLLELKSKYSRVLVSDVIDIFDSEEGFSEEIIIRVIRGRMPECVYNINSKELIFDIEQIKRMIKSGAISSSSAIISSSSGNDEIKSVNAAELPVLENENIHWCSYYGKEIISKKGIKFCKYCGEIIKKPEIVSEIPKIATENLQEALKADEKPLKSMVLDKIEQYDSSVLQKITTPANYETKFPQSTPVEKIERTIQKKRVTPLEKPRVYIERKSYRERLEERIKKRMETKAENKENEIEGSYIGGIIFGLTLGAIIGGIFGPQLILGISTTMIGLISGGLLGGIFGIFIPKSFKKRIIKNEEPSE